MPKVAIVGYHARELGRAPREAIAESATHSAARAPRDVERASGAEAPSRGLASGASAVHGPLPASGTPFGGQLASFAGVVIPTRSRSPPQFRSSVARLAEVRLRSPTKHRDRGSAVNTQDRVKKPQNSTPTASGQTGTLRSASDTTLTLLTTATSIHRASRPRHLAASGGIAGRR